MKKKLVYIGNIIRRAFSGNSKPRATLHIRVLHADGAIEDLGLVSKRVVTTAHVNHLVDALQAANAAFSNYKYHDSGTGTTASVDGDIALETPCGEARTVGSQTEGAAANIYKTVAIHTYAGNFDITEHCVFSAASGPTALDRSVFSAIPVVANDRIEFQYEITYPAGG